MDIKSLNRLLSDQSLVTKRINQYIEEKSLNKLPVDKQEVRGHIMKADHNLHFVNDIIKLSYPDWCITGCYYSVYHAALALIISKGYFSKNHDATICVLIKEYYKKGVSAEEIELLNKFFLDYQEIVFYVQAKDKREDASYSTKIKFDKQLVQELRIKAALFIDKAKQIIENLK